MFRRLQLLCCSVLSGARAGALTPLSSLTLPRGRFISKGPHIQRWARTRAPGHRDEDLYDPHGLEDVEDKLQDVIDKEVQKRKQLRFHILKRKMTPRGPPERKLTWDAMEEIRHLKREQPEEWTVSRLAEGFSVSTDVILRVLKSKFEPNPERKTKQDTKVMLKLKQQALPSGSREVQEKQRLPSAPAQKALSSGSGNSALIPLGQNSVAVSKQTALSIVDKKQISEITTKSAKKPYEEMQHFTELTEEEEDDEEEWDGQVFSEEDIDELINVKVSPVVKEGEEFFDVYGNFLYRI